MKQITIVKDKKGNITVDFDGFAGSTCFEEAQKLIKRLKELGVNIEDLTYFPKEDSKVQESEKQMVREGEF